MFFSTCSIEGDGRGGGGGVLMIDISTNLRSFIIIVQFNSFKY